MPVIDETIITKEIKAFKAEVKKDIEDFKAEVKKALEEKPKSGK